MIKTNALYYKYNPETNKTIGNKGDKWNNIQGKIWKDIKKGKKGKKRSGIIVIPSDPNALLERLDLLLASQEAGYTGVRNEVVSICDELKRQGVLNSMSYKNLISIIKK